MSYILLMGDFGLGQFYLFGTATPTFRPSLKFNDTGGAGGGDRNSMYVSVVMGLM